MDSHDDKVAAIRLLINAMAFQRHQVIQQNNVAMQHVAVCNCPADYRLEIFLRISSREDFTSAAIRRSDMPVSTVF
jgi:hypothetical protein